MITLSRSDQSKAYPLKKRREAATLTKMEFCLRVAELAILSGADAVSAAKGEWPSAMAGLLPLLTEAQQTSILIEWGASSEVSRVNVNVLTLASWLGLTDAQMDDLFMIEVP